MSGFGVHGANAVDVQDFKVYNDFLAFVKDFRGNTGYHNSFHMLNLVPYDFYLQIWHTGSIDVLSHPNIVLKNWEVLHDVITICVQDSLY